MYKLHVNLLCLKYLEHNTEIADKIIAFKSTYVAQIGYFLRPIKIRSNRTY